MNLFSFFIFIFSVFSSAESANTVNVTGTVQEMFCGEMNPFVGDMCVAFIEDGGKSYGLVLDFDAWQTKYNDIDALVGQELFAARCEKITDNSLISALKDYYYNSYYVQCETDFVTLSL